MTQLLDWAAGLLILAGSLFALTAAVGLLRLPDLYTRMHAASKAGTLGSCFMLLALALSAVEPAPALRALAGVVFFLLTAPISAHLLARAAYLSGHRLWHGSVADDMGRSLEPRKQTRAADQVPTDLGRQDT